MSKNAPPENVEDEKDVAPEFAGKPEMEPVFNDCELVLKPPNSPNLNTGVVVETGKMFCALAANALNKRIKIETNMPTRFILFPVRRPYNTTNADYYCKIALF